jgi:hypothetical protein
MATSIEARASHNSAGSLMRFDDEQVFLGDLLMPAQFYPAPRVTPCQRLLAAILEDAIRCFQKNCGARSMRGDIIFQEAEEWLFDGRGTGFMSCLTVCESLGINPIQLRRCLRKWKLNTEAGRSVRPVGRIRFTPRDSKPTCSKPGHKTTGVLDRLS